MFCITELFCFFFKFLLHKQINRWVVTYNCYYLFIYIISLLFIFNQVLLRFLSVFTDFFSGSILGFFAGFFSGFSSTHGCSSINFSPLAMASGIGGDVGRIEPLGRYPFSSAVYVIETFSPLGAMYSNDPLTASPALSSSKVFSDPVCSAFDPSPDMQLETIKQHLNF